MPLDRLTKRKIVYPEDPTVKPLVNYLKYDSRYEDAIMQVITPHAYLSMRLMLLTMQDRHGDLEVEIWTMQEELGTELQAELSSQDRTALKKVKQEISKLSDQVSCVDLFD